MRKLMTYIFLIFIAVFAWPAHSQEIIQSRGSDSRVDYRALTRFGPWDDRNYNLTRADLDLLAPNEEELVDPIPAFFRVLLRKNWPTLPTEGPAQYPRSALQIFRQIFGGYLINSRVYNRLMLEQGRYRVMEDERTAGMESGPIRFLDGEVRVTVPAGAAESAIKVNPVDPNIVVAGSNGPGVGQKMHFSTDGGESWTETPLPLGGTCCDPTVDWSSDGSLTYTATLGNCGFSGCAVWFYRSADNGQTWTDLAKDTPGDPRRELTSNGSDKEFLHVDKYSGSPHRDNIYLTWHDSNVMQFARSTDRGNNWSTISFTADPQGIGSDITTGKNGHIYYFWPATNTRQILLKRSTDGGVTFTPGTTMVTATNGDFDFPIPSMETRRAWIYVSVDIDLSDGPFGESIYVAWTDTTAPDDEFNPQNNHTGIQVAYSRDDGATWTIVTPHEIADQSTVDRWNQWLAVGPDGTVHVIFYDTRNDPNRESVDLYHSFSTDGAQTFSTPQRLTNVSSPNIADVFEFGDYNGLDAFMDKLIAVFTDNRQEGTGSGDSIDIYAVSPGIGITKAPFQYAAKFMCGKTDAKVVAPGTYFTAINVHNPTDTDVKFKKKIAVALPSEKPGPVSRHFDARLGPDQAFEIDCPDILEHIEQHEDFMKGFVVLESPQELDVVGVYTVAGGEGFVVTLDVERITGRSQTAEQSDLVPVPDPQPGIGYCKLNTEKLLVVTVENQGNGNAGPSTTRVDFGTFGFVDIPTPVISAGTSVDLPGVKHPEDCFNPDCDFHITVDFGNQLDESDEGNNVASGLCLG